MTTTPAAPTTHPRLFISHDTGLDWLTAIEFGRVDDGQPSDCWTGVTDQVGLLRGFDDGRIVGFKVVDFSVFDPDGPDAEAIWSDEHRFDTPMLGLTGASVGEIIVAARAHFGGESSINRLLFLQAIRAQGSEAEHLWRRCLEAGDSMAHFSLGYTLFKQERYSEAYRHLRHYTEISPAGVWNWWWYAKAAEAIGEPAEAVTGYRRAMKLDHEEETDAEDRLLRLDPISRGVDRADRIRGCFLGGAVGDALGAPIEFAALVEIQARFGPSGLTEFVPAYGRYGAITDDTQMTLFTAEGLIRALTRARLKGICHPPAVVDHAYSRWLLTQGESSGRWADDEADGWLVAVEGLRERRAPGATCLSALKAPEAGTIGAPLNDSKGCGGVMRAAPAGLMGTIGGGDPFALGCDIAALTHGHPSGYLAAGALAAIVAGLLDGQKLASALDEVQARLVGCPGHEETLGALLAARTLADAGVGSPEAVESLGQGWIAEEALAIAVYCTLVAPNFEEGVVLAANHSGDSDSTAAIAGNLLGVIHGASAIPEAWTDDLELLPVIERIADDWIRCFASDEEIDMEAPEWWAAYPGW